MDQKNGFVWIGGASSRTRPNGPRAHCTHSDRKDVAHVDGVSVDPVGAALGLRIEHLQFDIPAIGVGPADRALDDVDRIQLEISSGAFGEGDLCLISVCRREIESAVLRSDTEIAERVIDAIEEVEKLKM